MPRLYNIVFVFIMPLFQNKYRIKSTRLPKWDYGFVQLHEYVIMPNHVHGILEICKRRDEALPRLTIDEAVPRLYNEVIILVEMQYIAPLLLIHKHILLNFEYLERFIFPDQMAEFFIALKVLNMNSVCSLIENQMGNI